MTGDRLTRRPLEWLIPNLIPRNQLTLCVGDTGTGKSTFFAALAAMVTAGVRFADEDAMPLSRVLYYVNEEEVEGETADRMEAAGADLSRWIVGDQLHDGRPAPRPHLPDQLQQLDARIRQVRPALLIFDPLTSYLSPGINIMDGQHVRATLEGLLNLTRQHGLVTLFTLHNRKSREGGCLDWIAGSREWSQVPRMVLAFGADPRTTGSYVLAVAKFSRGAPIPSRSYRLEGHAGSARFVLTGRTETTAQEMGVDLDEPLKRKAKDLAKAYLRRTLDEGDAKVVTLTLECVQGGFSPSTLERAADELGVMKEHRVNGSDRAWWWCKPEAWPT